MKVLGAAVLMLGVAAAYVLFIGWLFMLAVGNMGLDLGFGDSVATAALFHALLVAAANSAATSRAR